MTSVVLSVALAIASATGAHGLASRPVVAIQPYGSIDRKTVEQVLAGIARQYDVEVVVLPACELPSSAYYRPRDRYRADQLLDALDAEARGRYAKIVGLTTRDISTTTERHADFGIFGLGDLGGTPCVVSTYRLGRGGAGEELRRERLVKAVNHELGHTFGVDHCPVGGCLMGDALGTLQRVDGGSGALCATCQARLGGLVKPPSPPTASSPFGT